VERMVDRMSAGAAGRRHSVWSCWLRRRILLIAALTLLALSDTTSWAAVPQGVWLMDARVAVQIYSCADLLCGRILWLQIPRDPQGRLDRDKHNLKPALQQRPLCGLTVLWNLYQRPKTLTHVRGALRFAHRSHGTGADGSVFQAVGISALDPGGIVHQRPLRRLRPVFPCLLGREPGNAAATWSAILLRQRRRHGVASQFSDFSWVRRQCVGGAANPSGRAESRIGLSFGFALAKLSFPCSAPSV
jgi:hypothetical protein